MSLSLGCVDATSTDDRPSPDSGLDTGGTSPVPVVVSIADASVGEDATKLIFEVSIDVASTTPVTFEFETVDGTALAGVDYEAARGSGQIAVGAERTSLEVSLLGDTLRELDETLHVNLSNLSDNAIFGTEQATGTIVDDDSAVGWQSPIDLGAGSEPSVAMDSAGNGAIVFNVDADPDPIASDDQIGVVRFTQGSQGAVEFVEDLAFNSVRPRVAMTGEGRVMAIWRDTSVEASLYEPGIGWQPQTVLAQGSNFNVALAANEAGDVLASWQRNPDADYPVSKGYRAVFDPTTNQWASPEVLELDDTGNGGIPVVAIDDMGDGIAVWFQDFATFELSGLYHATYDASTATWSAPIELDGSFGFEPVDASMRSDGTAVVALQKQGFGGDADSVDVIAYTSLGDTWLDLGEPQASDEDVRVPQLAVDGSDNVFVVWLESNDGLWDVYGNRYDQATGQWSVPTLLEQSVGSAQVVVNGLDVAADANGNAMAVWSQNVSVPPAVEFRIRGARFDGTAMIWEAAEQIDVSAIGTGSVEPQIAMSDHGEALIVWEYLPEPRIGAAVYVDP